MRPPGRPRRAPGVEQRLEGLAEPRLPQRHAQAGGRGGGQGELAVHPPEVAVEVAPTHVTFRSRDRDPLFASLVYSPSSCAACAVVRMGMPWWLFIESRSASPETMQSALAATAAAMT